MPQRGTPAKALLGRFPLSSSGHERQAEPDGWGNRAECVVSIEVSRFTFEGVSHETLVLEEVADLTRVLEEVSCENARFGETSRVNFGRSLV